MGRGGWQRLPALEVTRISYSRTDTLLEHGLAGGRGWTSSVVGFPSFPPRRVFRRPCVGIVPDFCRPGVSDVHRRRLFAE